MKGMVIAASSQLCLDVPPPVKALGEYCPPGAGRASVQGVGGTDAVLAARLAAGDDHALAEVFDALAHSVHGSAVRVLGDNSAAQDVVQDVFVELWVRPDRYDPAAGTLRTYLTVLARHRAVDVVRSELRRVARQERSWRLTPAPPAAGAGEEVVAAETASVPGESRTGDCGGGRTDRQGSRSAARRTITPAAGAGRAGRAGGVSPLSAIGRRVWDGG